MAVVPGGWWAVGGGRWAVGGRSRGSSSSAYVLRLQVDFVRAERSAFVWTEDDVKRIHRNGARVNFLPDASHWVHIDNPQGQPACEKWPPGGAAARQPGLGRRTR